MIHILNNKTIFEIAKSIIERKQKTENRKQKIINHNRI